MSEPSFDQVDYGDDQEPPPDASDVLQTFLGWSDEVFRDRFHHNMNLPTLVGTLTEVTHD